MAERVALSIRLLEPEPNARGDLFTRLTEDLLHVLGYESLRTNVQHAGREVDIVARHRTENRRAIVECKATKDLIGGDALNKFYGVLDLERRRAGDTPVEGYYVSLSGFRGTAVEQELDATAPRFVLMEGGEVVEQLVEGGILIAEDDATVTACAIGGRPPEAQPLKRSELLGCRLGWIWCVAFGAGSAATHVALVHASGTPLSREIAQEVIAQDRLVGGTLGDLELVAPPSTRPDEELGRQALSAYGAYLQQEFGFVTLEGLPADQEVGAARIPLKELFVPIALRHHVDEEPQGPSDRGSAEAQPTFGLGARLIKEDDSPFPSLDLRDLGARIPVAEVLAEHRHVAILAAPGGGKSTLLKHLTTASALPAHGEGLAPFPVVIRCRQLRDANAPLLEALKDLPRRGEFPHLADAFEALLENALLTGRLTVLIDGLDEIADDGTRVAFAWQLRTFAAQYPDVQMVVTSRPGGYRAIAGVLGSVCQPYRIADLRDDDIIALTKAWHGAVVGPGAHVQEEAEALGARIIANDRVRLLATNPLLLTTLLLVKRWVGDLPRKRSVLYDRAIEVLLKTWNVEGHGATVIELDEAIPQLAYVAYEMTAAGEQTISGPRLEQLLQEAREAMPAILGYTDVGVGEFIRRIEDRSSVLSMSGRMEEAGRLVARYEFKHLTFQEYLAARALTDGFCAPRLEGATLVEVLTGRLGRPEWEEIALLAGVLAGPDAAELVLHLIEEGRAALKIPEEDPRAPDWPVDLLVQSLADGIQIAPSLAREACEVICGLLPRRTPGTYLDEVLDTRCGPIFRAVAQEGLLAGGDGLVAYSHAAMHFVVPDFGIPDDLEVETGTWTGAVSRALEAEDWLQQTAGCLAVIYATWTLSSRFADGDERTRSWLEHCVPRLLPLLRSPVAAVSYNAAWALAWLGIMSLIREQDRAAALLAPLRLWRDEQRPNDHRRMAAWAFLAVPLVDRDGTALARSSDGEELIAFAAEESRLDPEDSEFRLRRVAAHALTYYLQGAWSEPTLMELRVAEPANLRLEDVVERLVTSLREAEPRGECEA